MNRNLIIAGIALLAGVITYWFLNDEESKSVTGIFAPRANAGFTWKDNKVEFEMFNLEIHKG
jgi:hypothetical protein